MSKKSRRVFLIGPVLGGVGELRTLLRRASFSAAKCERVIAVDQGVARAKAAGLRVDLALGDWDSLTDHRLLRGIPCLALPEDKDRSDLWYALGAARNFGATEVVCLGFSGGRPDHHFAVMMDVAGILEFFPGGASLISLDAEYSFFRGPGWWRKKIKKGALVSLFALGRDAEGVSTRGLKFGLKRELLPVSSRGLSNVSVGTRVEVEVGKGSLMIVEPKKGASW